MTRSPKPIKQLTNEELLIERKHWDDLIRGTTMWGAALTAADEFRKDCEIELRIRGIPYE